VQLHALIDVAVILCFAYLALVFALFIVMLAASAPEGSSLTSQGRTEDYDLLSNSRFTIPVSVIVPACNDARVITPALQSLLALEYPEYEIIVVNDGSKDDTLAVLERTFDLERREVFYRKRFDTASVRSVSRSRTHPNLIVVDKANGGKADALNAGLNLARYPYLCTVDSDTVYFRDALLRSMQFPMRDPERIAGVTSNVSISGRWNFMLRSVGALAVWRHDLVVELGGFATGFTSEHIELTFRVHEHLRRAGRPFRIVALADSVGRTEGPETLARLISQRARWQRAIAETVWHYRRMLFNPRYGSAGLAGAPYYFIVDVLAPVVQLIAVMLLPAAWWAGTLNVREFVLLVATIACANGLLTNFALLQHEEELRGHASRDLVRLMVLGLIDLVVYRPVMILAGARGLLDFLRGVKSWNGFERNKRGDGRTSVRRAASPSR